MAQSNMELRVTQKRTLFTLYNIKRLNFGKNIVGLDDEIIRVEAEMEQEDVAFVKEKINESVK